jgi:hypothetical protein
MTLFLSTFLGVLVLFGYRILLFQVFDQFLVGILECLAEPLTKIFQKSIETRKIPNTWKLANVTPLHKKGPKQQVTNYRPISLTSIK